MAFEYYKQKQVDIVALEVGMGGRLDATNIIDPLVSIIVSIGLDHVETLGPTVYDIASKIQDLVDLVGEKAGIIKAGRPAVVGPFTPIEIFQERANEVKSDLTAIDVDKDIIRDFDIENSRIAEYLCLLNLNFRAALRILADKYTQFQIPEEAYEKGLKAKQPMRLEYIDTNTLQDNRWRGRKLILDVGHNPPAIVKFNYCK
jgi:dihydrofolate synthase / folylpolyglutamate synthase